jgi:hypothetical protein
MFQKMVAIIAFSILIITLILTGIFLARRKGTGNYPPVVGTCPDYWEEQKVDNKNMCVNVKNLGNCGIDKKDFNITEFKGEIGNCHKKRFAENCDLTWDGITNNANICK